MTQQHRGERGVRPRFDIEVLVSVRGNRRAPFIWNRVPLRPGSVIDELRDATQQQYDHMAYSGRFVVKGLDYIEKHQKVFMWAPANHRACVIRAVERKT